MNPSLPDRTTLSATITGLLSREIKVPVNEIQLNRPLTQYGLDSMAVLTMAGELEDHFGLELPSTLLWDYPTINDVANFLHDALHAGAARAEA